jgi:hypothetical protein
MVQTVIPMTTPATSILRESSGTNVFPGKNNASNAVGQVGPSTFAITNPPYQLGSCDQVLLIESQRIINMRDYSKREKVFFTFSMYLINVFQEKNADKLIDSLGMDKINTLPYVMQGAPTCVNFPGDKKNIAMCFDKEEYTGEIIQVYKDLLDCRKGKKVLTVEEMRQIVQQCQAAQAVSTVGVTTGITGTTGTAGIVGAAGAQTSGTNATPGVGTPTVTPNGVNQNPYVRPNMIVLIFITI